MFLKDKIAFGLDTFYLPLVQQILSKKTVSNKIVICSMARGGSTWLGEILSGIDKAIVFNEPFSKDKLSEFKSISNEWDQPVPQGSSWEEFDNFTTNLFKGNILKSSLFSKNNLMKLPFGTTFIFKTVNSHLFLPYLVDKFPDIKFIYLIRNPFGVINSQLNSTFWDTLVADYKIKYDNIKYNEVYKSFENELLQVNSIHTNLAARWAIKNKYLISHPYNNKKWMTVCYEDLYENTYKEVDRMFAYLNLTPSKRVLDNCFKVSKTALQSSHSTIKNGNQLALYETTLTKEIKQDITHILKVFQCDQYYDGIYPNKNILQP